MADRDIESSVLEVPEIPELVEQLLITVLDDAKEKMEAGEEVVPFTGLVVKGNLFYETHPGNDATECFNAARHTVEGARGADAYAFCYDGYVNADDDVNYDALIAESGLPGEAEAYAVGYLYKEENGKTVFTNEPVYIGPAPNFMEALKEAIDYGEDEIEAKYLEAESEAEE